MWAYTLYNRLNIWRTKLANGLGKVTPVYAQKTVSQEFCNELGIPFVPSLLGKICSSSILLCTQLIKCSMYAGADIFVGRLYCSESCQRYSNLFTMSAPVHKSQCMLNELIRSLHFGARSRRAKLGNRSIEKINVIIKIDHYMSRLLARLKPPFPKTWTHAPLTASHSFKSSPSGNLTAFLKLPLPSVASANCLNW